MLTTSDGIFNMSGGSITGNTGNDVAAQYIRPKINLSGNAEIGYLSINADNVNVKTAVTANGFTGKVESLDLTSRVTGITNAINYWVGVQVIAVGSGTSLGGINLGNFISSDGMTTPIKPNYHLFGTKIEETDAARFGRLVQTKPSNSNVGGPFIDNGTVTISNITPTGFRASWTKARDNAGANKLRYRVVLLVPTSQNNHPYVYPYTYWAGETWQLLDATASASLHDNGVLDIDHFDVEVPEWARSTWVQCLVVVTNEAGNYAYYHWYVTEPLTVIRLQ